MTNRRHHLGRGLADAFLAGEWEPASMTRRGQRAVAQRRVWVTDLALAARHAYPEPPLDRPHELATFLAACPPLLGAMTSTAKRSEPPLTIKHWFLAPTAMGAAPWPVTPLHSIRDLQDVLGMPATTLLWFADTRQLERTVSDERLRHYRYRWLIKRDGGARLIEEPKALLMHIQRVLLREILNAIPVHPDAHGFRRGRSTLTYAGGHIGRRVVVHLDLEDFFGSIFPGRIFGIFRRCGYPEPVSHLLTGLVTNTVPRSVWAAAPYPATEAMIPAHNRLGRHLAHPHLPQGAPTSPALANLAAFGLDRRLAALAAASGLSYSRYADDLALSCPRHRSDRELARLTDLVTAIAADEGFRINSRKTSIRRASQRQRLAGVVVNDHPNIDRRDYDRLKAIIHNAALHGPQSQNLAGHVHFREHLLGRIGWVNQLNRSRGQHLLASFDRIDWSQADPGSESAD